MSPTISVIVPVYKVEPLLDRCVDSILRQSYGDLEVILVDDGSPDRCGAICDEYASKDPRVRVIHQKNSGVASARNAGLAIAGGEYIGFVDGDDRIHPDMYRTLLECVRRENADIAVCGRFLETNHGVRGTMFISAEQQVLDSQQACRKLLLSEGLDSASWDKLYRRELWDGVQYPAYYISEDVPVTAQLLLRAGRIVHCGKPLYYYNQREGSRSRSIYQEKNLGLYYFFKEAGEKIAGQFPRLQEESQYFFFKNFLVLLFQYADAGNKGPVGKELYRCLRDNIGPIMRNRFLKKTYKAFALAACCRMDRPAVFIAKVMGVRENRH
ncbi:MAG: glycosyltransferase [Oscillospiraceae bacterium]|nr:glycosyltransferase [Oscillospiraceae bacterium]